MYSTLLVSVPTGVKFFSWVATMWKGKITFPSPMLFVLGGIVVFLLGGLSGPPNATVSTDLMLNNTYYIVAISTTRSSVGMSSPYLQPCTFGGPR